MDTHANVEGSAARQSEATNDVACLCTCTGSVITIGTREEGKFIFGQLAVLAVAVFSSLLALLIYNFY